jgi:hypothetical protein
MGWDGMGWDVTISDYVINVYDYYVVNTTTYYWL